MDIAQLQHMAKVLSAPGKGLLAADESTTTMFSRLRGAGIEDTDEMQRSYREMLFSAPGIEQYFSGVIMYDTSMYDVTVDGVSFPDLLTARGIVPGIKVDMGTTPFPRFPGEFITNGLDGLPERLAEYYDLGARFTKWRAVFEVSDAAPTDQGVRANALMLARYAALAQDAGLVPIVEPEVLMHGSHSQGRAEQVTQHVLQTLFAVLREYRVDLSGLILKSSMVLAGDGHPDQTSPQGVADATLRVFHNAVPYDVGGIVFLSGGQTPKRATENLQEIASRGSQPWPITFSYSRAIEEPVLAAWKGDAANAVHAQEVLLARARFNSRASLSTYNAAEDV